MTASGTRFRRWGVVGANVGPGVEYVFSRTGRPSQRLSSGDALLLEGCSSFRTLEEHARIACAREGTPEQHESFQGVLSELVAKGCLLSREDVLARLRTSTMPRSQSALRTLVIPTRGRDAMLDRCITSFAENAATFERSLEIVVADDSASQESLGALRSMHLPSGVRLGFLGDEQKRAFVSAVAREAGVPEATVAFAMLGSRTFPGAGANRNVLLLHQAGASFLSVDDDVVCHFGRPRPSPKGAALSSALDSLDMFLFEDEAAALAAAPERATDALALYEASLGRTAFDVVSEASELSGMREPLEERLESARATVRVVMAGVVGDSGMANPSWFLMLPPGVRARLLESRARYAAHTTRQVLRVARQEVVTDSPFLMGYAMAVDARALVPPFVPFGRNQDGLFGLTLGHCIGGALIAHIPWAVRHAPVPARSFAADEIWRSASRVRSDLLLRALIASVDVGPGKQTDGDRLRAVGTSLLEMGALPRAQFEEAMRFSVWTLLKEQATAIGAALRNENGRPDYWAADATRGLELLAETAAQPDDRLFDVPGEDLEAQYATLRPALQDLGALFHAWPEIFSAAHRLRERGQTFTIAP